MPARNQEKPSLFASALKWRDVYEPALRRVGYPYDPDAFIGVQWPHVRLYPKQQELLHSVRDNRITVCYAAHETGKDFMAALIVLWFFCSREPAIVLTTSTQEKQLDTVLWGEMRKQMAEAQYPELLGLQYNSERIWRVRQDGTPYEQSRIIKQVARSGEAFQGYHLPEDVPRTFVVFDEASGMSDEHYTSAKSWAHRILVIGNPLPTTNFFYRDSKAGDLADVALSGVG